MSVPSTASRGATAAILLTVLAVVLLAFSLLALVRPEVVMTVLILAASVGALVALDVVEARRRRS
jgi:hypothetical protein